MTPRFLAPFIATLLSATAGLSIQAASFAEDPPSEQGTVDAAGKFTPRPTLGTSNVSPSMTPGQVEAALRDASGLSQTGPDSYRVGRITLDRKERIITIPARVNPQQGVIEYALVAETGKRHESLFVTDARPEQLHLACLLLGLTATNLTAHSNGGLVIPPANALKIEVAWDKPGGAARKPLASLIAIAKGGSTEAGVPMSEGDWLYTGSRFTDAGFVAQTEGSFISLIADDAALINNPRPGRLHDDIHVPNRSLLPADSTAVRILLRLPPTPK